MDTKKFFVRLFSENWHRLETIFVILVSTLVLSLYFLSDIKISEIDLYTLIFILFLCLLIFFVWLKFVIIPKNKTGHVGIVISIDSENEEERRVIESDLIRAMVSAFDDSKCHVKFKIIQLPPWHASRISDADAARIYLKKCRAHLLIYGIAKERVVNKKPSHFIKIRQIAAHAPIDISMSKSISDEMSSVMPGNILVDRENELIGLEITSLWIAEAAKYFIAIASMASQNFDLSESLLVDLKSSKFLARVDGSPAIPKLRQLVIFRLADVYFLKSRNAHNRWRKSRLISDLDETYLYIEKSYLTDQRYIYNYRLGKAIWHFCRQNNVNSAVIEIDKCRGSVDASWRYSLAFLESFNGNLDRAIDIYNKAFKRPAQPHVLFEVEEFITWVLGNNPEKYQLYFCLGLINMKGKHDKLLAIKDFQIFLEKCEANKHEKARRLVNQYVQQLKREIELGNDCE